MGLQGKLDDQAETKAIRKEKTKQLSARSCEQHQQEEW